MVCRAHGKVPQTAPQSSCTIIRTEIDNFCFSYICIDFTVLFQTLFVKLRARAPPSITKFEHFYSIGQGGSYFWFNDREKEAVHSSPAFLPLLLLLRLVALASSRPAACTWGGESLRQFRQLAWPQPVYQMQQEVLREADSSTSQGTQGGIPTSQRSEHPLVVSRRHARTKYRTAISA